MVTTPVPVLTEYVVDGLKREDSERIDHPLVHYLLKHVSQRPAE